MEPRPAVTIAQALPARVRLAAPSLAGRREACERVARALAETGAFARVTARPVTGSVIVEGDDAPLAPDALRDHLEALLHEAHDAPPPSPPLPHPSPTRLAQAVARAAADVNADVRAALDERADLGTLLPLFFAVAGVAEVGATGELPAPTWFSLLWWSLRSFMTFNFEAVTTDDRGGSEAAARRELVSEI